MIGGLNRAYLTDISGSQGKNYFNLGFYFHVNLKNNSFISTGVMVKSSAGATGMPVYSFGNADFDSVYKDGTQTKKISCFYLPIMYQQRFNKRWYIEAGPQFGIRTKAVDIFEKSTDDGDLRFIRDAKNEYTCVDAGIIAGAGYKTQKILKSLAFGISYYYGLVNISTTPGVTMRNSSLNFYVKLPIGLGADQPKKL